MIAEALVILHITNLCHIYEFGDAHFQKTGNLWNRAP